MFINNDRSDSPLYINQINKEDTLLEISTEYGDVARLEHRDILKLIEALTRTLLNEPLDDEPATNISVTPKWEIVPGSLRILTKDTNGIEILVTEHTTDQATYRIINDKIRVQPHVAYTSPNENLTLQVERHYPEHPERDGICTFTTKIQ